MRLRRALILVPIALLAWGISRLTASPSEPSAVTRTVEIQNQTVADYNKILNNMSHNPGNISELLSKIQIFSSDSLRLAHNENTSNAAFNDLTIDVVTRERTLIAELNSFATDPTQSKINSIQSDVAKLNASIRKSNTLLKNAYGA